MNNVLVLGAGMVVKPFVHYLLDQPDFQVKVASRTVGKAVRIIGNHPRGEAQVLDVSDTRALRALISDAQTDLVASFVPPAYHADVAKLCIEARKPMVTTSYVSDSTRALDKQAREAGVLILGEIGLDPGIDHMSAMKAIHKVQGEGGKVVSFYSVCGAIPAPEASLNPFGYKFSWFPRGALSAAKRPAKYLQDGQETTIPSHKLLDHYSLRYIEGLGYFENYPNMNCLPYIDTYGIPTTRAIYRGTLRYMGWCETLK
ncbi:saccharopine dehydrogenase NADP-binding domain-containing protein, partial [Candidatus Bipolaricaulota bacterium]|nr:saccharopine dehydrogenase NADP-binding domain-containing protein [Candidatus Bipolaricaulota bacterium]